LKIKDFAKDDKRFMIYEVEFKDVQKKTWKDEFENVTIYFNKKKISQRVNDPKNIDYYMDDEIIAAELRYYYGGKGK